jgi:GxxExxY protein
VELARRRLDFKREVSLTLRYDELAIPRAYVLDFIVVAIVVELKATAMTTHLDKRQVQTYLEISGYPLGLALNFGATMFTDQVKHVVNNFPEGSRGLCDDTFLIR